MTRAKRAPETIDVAFAMTDISGSLGLANVSAPENSVTTAVTSKSRFKV
jgi:hypothetical protein